MRAVWYDRQGPVGDGVDARRVGRRVWVFGAQSYRPFGTAAEFTVVPDQQAADLPAGVGDEVGACLGIPGTAAAGEGALSIAVDTVFPLDATAEAHDRVDAGPRGRVLVRIAD